jgi:catechol 2,3-dioxygenase-like lactoylglutathione lyase family enzyme
MRAIDHIGLLVPDLDEAVALFVDVIGYDPAGAPALAADDRGRVLHSARLRLANGPDLVVEQLDRPDGAPVHPRWGMDAHPCWYVDDMDAAVAHLHARGLAVRNPVMEGFGPEEGAGSSYIHFLSPWGQDLELVSYPHVRAYERQTALRLWHPARPDTWEDDDESTAPAAPAGGLPGNRGTVHMGFRVPDLDEAVDYLVGTLSCELVYRHPTLQRSGGRWVEIPDGARAPEPDRSVPDDRYQPGTRVRVAYLRCANFNFEPFAVDLADEHGMLRTGYDADAATVAHPAWRVASVDEAGARLEASGARPDRTLPGVPRWLTPWGQAVGVYENGRRSG